MKKSLILAVAALLALSACSKQEVVSHQTLEDARAQSQANSTMVAKAYIRENPRLKGSDIVGHSDEAQSPDCPQGSGWAYPSAIRTTLDADGRVASVEKTALVCSTVSANLGCYRAEDFKNTKFNEKVGQCDRSLPFPLPKVVGK